MRKKNNQCAVLPPVGFERERELLGGGGGETVGGESYSGESWHGSWKKIASRNGAGILDKSLAGVVGVTAAAAAGARKHVSGYGRACAASGGGGRL